MESALKVWFTNVHDQDAHVDGSLMQQKVEERAKKMWKDSVTTDRWFQHCKKRENAVYKCMHGEQDDADFVRAENWIKNRWP